MAQTPGVFHRIRRINPTQQAVLEDRHRAICVQGGLGSGKSLLLEMDAIITGLDNPGCDILIIRKTFEQVADSVIADLEANFVYKELFPEEILYGGKWSKAFFKNDRRPYLLLNTPGKKKSKFHFRGAMHDGKEDPSRFGSMPFLAAYFEEFSDFDNPRVFNYIDGRCRQEVPSNPYSYNRILLVGNPPMDTHWSQKEFRALPAEDPQVAALRSFYLLPTRENLDNLPDGYYQNMLATYSEAWIRRYLNGEAGIIEVGQPVLEGAYLSNTRDGRPWHLHPEPLEFNPGWPVIRAWDFGVAYMSCVWMQFIPLPYPRVIILYEHTGQNTNAYKFGQKIKPMSQNMFPNAKFIDVGDPTGKNRSLADGKSPFKVLREKHGIFVHAAPTNSVSARINVMVEFLSKTSRPAEPYVILSGGMGTQRLRDGFEAGWSYKREEGGYINPGAVPIKNQYSHGCDAAGYGFLYIDNYSDSIEPTMKAGTVDYFDRMNEQRNVIVASQPKSWMGR